MWDETLIESKRAREKSKKWLAVPVAFFIHAFVVAVLLSASYWNVEAVSPKQPGIQVFLSASPPGPPVAFGIPHSNHSHTTTRNPPIQSPPVVPQVVPQNIEGDVSDDSESFNNEMNGEELGPGRPDGVVGADPATQGQGSGWGIADDVPDDEPHIITPQISQPVLLKKVEPLYPLVAIRGGIEGTVVLQAIISKTGAVENAEILKSAHPLLNEAAVKAVLQWQYRPAMLNQHPVKVYFTVTVKFAIHR